eukprot:5556195-Prymnesium_polylepis.1
MQCSPAPECSTPLRRRCGRVSPTCVRDSGEGWYLHGSARDGFAELKKVSYAVVTHGAISRSGTRMHSRPK